MVNSESKSEEEKDEKERRREYYEELGVEPKRVEEPPARPESSVNKIMVALLDKDIEDGVTRYQLKKETGLSYPQVHEVVGGREEKEKETGLVEKNLLQSKKIGTAPGGQPKIAYALTLKGMGWTLRNYRKIAWEEIDRIAEKQADLLPRIFGNWKLFKKEGVDRKVFECLIDPKFAVSNDPDTYLDVLFNNLFEKSPPGKKGGRLHKIFQVFKKDKELASEARSWIREVYKELKAEFETVEKIQDMLKGIN